MAFGAPKGVVETAGISGVSHEVVENDIYSIDKSGPYYYVKGGDIYFADSAGKQFTKIDSEIADKYGVAYSESAQKLTFTKDVKGEAFEYGDKCTVYKSSDGIFATVYNAFVGIIDGWFDKIGASGVFNILCYVLAALNFLLLLYQLNSNWWLKKNTERIIACCINGKAIIQAMQYEDITLMNGRQRQRYYQGQVTNEAVRNTGDPLYFGS